MRTSFYNIKSSSYIILISSIAAIAGLLLGYDAGVIADSKDQVTKLFSLSDNQWSLTASASIFGALVGLPISGYLSSYIGRKLMLIIVAIGFFIGIILSATSSDIISFIAGRFIIGISIGIGSFTAPLFISEIAPPKIRGTLILINGIAITSGQALSFLIGYFIHDVSIEGWRYIIWIEILPAICLFIGMLFVPQSPRWIAMKHGIDKARLTLKSIRGNSYDIDAELNEIQNNIKQNNRKVSFIQLFSKQLIPVTTVGVVLGLLQQFVGISTIMYYGPVIFTNAGFVPIDHAILATFYIGMVNLLATFATMFLVDYFGRRPLLLFGTLLAGISLIFVGAANIGYIHGKWLTFMFMTAYIVGYCIGLGSLFWVIIAEIYPFNVRGLGMSIASAAETGASLLVTITFLQILRISGLSGAFWLYSLISFIAFIFIYYNVPETKGVSLEKIEADLKSGASFRDIGNRQLDSA
jgi:MFS transporter, SP family, galactose:H+ symporter